MTITAQELNTKIALQRVTLTIDDEGYSTEAWTEYGQAFARVDTMLGREYLAAAQVQAEDNVKVTMRWRGDVNAADRLIMRGETWDIVSVQNIRWRNRELLLVCKRLAGD
jgi:SPP1 family predicted phage head-tail adaptor